MLRLCLIVLAAGGMLNAGPVRFKKRCLADLVSQVPKLLAAQDRATGRFGEGIWIVNDQNVMLALAAAWHTKDPANPYFHSREVLDAVMAAGDALIDDQDAGGRWVFRKKDGSTWGSIFMPWTYSRWIRSFALIREAMPPGRRARWEKALRLGYTGISKELETGRLHNIPAHHAMGLYVAGRVFEESGWRQQAQDYLRRIAASQQPDGYWSEHKGPVVAYGFVYVDALGTYYSYSHDAAVLPALRRSAVFHTYFTYPDGSDVETVDERNPYHPGVRLPNPGFTYTPEGRAYVSRQLSRRHDPVPGDEAALLLLHGEEGPGLERDPVAGDFDFVLGDGNAAVRRRGPWFLVLSAITAPVSNSRWIQDRQNFFSVYHDKTGLILGGGNTKLQPRWSTFTIGETGLLRHKPGDEHPVFEPPAGLLHVPQSAYLLPPPDFGVKLDYGKASGTLRLHVAGPDKLECIFAGESSMAGHLTVLRSTVEDAGFRLLLPQGAVRNWPVFPHDPYKKDGRADLEQARLVVDLPPEAKVTLQIR